MHRFVDYGEPGGLGLALITDYKYGVSVRDGSLGLTLLKSGQFPYKETDKGHHEFTYSMLVRSNGIESGEVQSHADALNAPLIFID